MALVGEHALRLSQPNGFGGFSGVSQGVSIAAGERLVIDASVLLPEQGSIAGTGNSLLMKVEFYDVFDGQFQSANFLGQSEIVVANGATTTGDWTAHRIDETAPAGAVEARLVFVYARSQNQNGAVLIDDVRLRLAEPLAGDFNRDGVINAADYTVWRDGLGTTYAQADYVDWLKNFGASSAAIASAVPEPMSALMVLISCGAAGASGRR
jgi:hypothetical protein